MGRRKPVLNSPAARGDAERTPVLAQPAIATGANPLVFISHDSRDADLAEAFDHLLTDASGGVVQTFRSSDQTGRAGIDYGEDWFSKITRTLSEASDVVALLTPNSVDRPWILFEAGFAVGQRSTKVFGIALGVPFAKATRGPFARFQNCEAKEDPVTTVVLELIRRNQNARPREEAVRRQVATFLSEIDPMLNERAASDAEPEEMDATAAAKLFEEVKVMFRDLPSRVEGHLREHGVGRRRRKIHPLMFEEVFHLAQVEGSENPAAAWLFISSFFKDELPWFSEIGLQLYRAIQAGDAKQIEQAQLALHDVVRMARHSRLMLRGPEDEETYMFMRHVPQMLEESGLLPPAPERKPKRGRQDSPAPETKEAKG
jgi:hypothetical protein